MINLKASGIEALLAKFNTLAKEAQNDIQLELNAFGDDVARDAKYFIKENKSENMGNLKMKIFSESGNGNITITADTNYAAYVEFGTRKFAASYVSTLPEDWQKFASSFKGPMIGNGILTMWEAIRQWGDDKGLERSHSYFIYKKILTEGSKPHPFMYPSINKNLPLLVQNIKDIFQ